MCKEPGEHKLSSEISYHIHAQSTVENVFIMPEQIGKIIIELETVTKELDEDSRIPEAIQISMFIFCKKIVNLEI